MKRLVGTCAGRCGKEVNLEQRQLQIEGLRCVVWQFLEQVRSGAQVHVVQLDQGSDLYLAPPKQSLAIDCNWPIAAIP